MGPREWIRLEEVTAAAQTTTQLTDKELICKEETKLTKSTRIE